jgi:hypothetical protein
MVENSDTIKRIDKDIKELSKKDANHEVTKDTASMELSVTSFTQVQFAMITFLMYTVEIRNAMKDIPKYAKYAKVA